MHFSCLGFTGCAAPVPLRLSSTAPSNWLTTQTRKMRLNMTESNAITLISYSHFPGVVALKGGSSFSPPLPSLPNKNEC